MAYVQRKIPFVGTPDTNPETKPFFDGCAAGKLVLPQCVETKKFIWYPRAISPFTLGPVEWKEVSGKGKVVIVGLNEDIKSTMSATGFLKFFTTADTLDEGVKALDAT